MEHDVSSREITAALKRLGKYRGKLSTQQLRVIRGQVIAGDICGAEKGLRRLLSASFLKEEQNHEVQRTRQ